MSDQVLQEKRESTVLLTVNRPSKLNALNRSVIRELTDRLRGLESDPDVRAVVIAGAGDKAFVAGADIGEIADLDPPTARAFAREGQALGEVMDELGKPVIAAVDGFALGGGCELALSCHIRLCTAQSRFGQPEVGLGLIPGFGGTQRLPRVVGEGRALQMICAGKPIDAQTAQAWGLVNAVVDGDVVDAALDMAGQIARQAPLAVKLSVEAVRNGLQMPLSEALEYEAALFGLSVSTEDMREGTKAFLEKRKPNFQGL